jgi:hypothetical protein
MEQAFLVIIGVLAFMTLFSIVGISIAPLLRDKEQRTASN